MSRAYESLAEEVDDKIIEKLLLSISTDSHKHSLILSVLAESVARIEVDKNVCESAMEFLKYIFVDDWEDSWEQVWLKCKNVVPVRKVVDRATVKYRDKMSPLFAKVFDLLKVDLTLEAATVFDLLFPDDVTTDLMNNINLMFDQKITAEDLLDELEKGIADRRDEVVQL